MPGRQRAQIKSLDWKLPKRAKHVSETLGSMPGESAEMLCLVYRCRAGLGAEVFVEDCGDDAGADNGASALVEA